MSKIEQLTVEVGCRLAVSDSTAIVCMKLLEEYINQHPEKDIVGTRQDNGTITLEIVNKHEDGRFKLKPRKADTDEA